MMIIGIRKCPWVPTLFIRIEGLDSPPFTLHRRSRPLSPPWVPALAAPLHHMLVSGVVGSEHERESSL